MDTPIETYLVQGRSIYVKREDLAYDMPYPRLAKLRGIVPLRTRLKAEGVRTIGVYDTRVSKAGWGVAAACRELQLECVECIPLVQGEPIPPSAAKAIELGARPYHPKAGRANVCYYFSKEHVETLGGVMLPMGLCCTETVGATAGVARQLPPELKRGTIAICTGTGTILAGVIAGAPEATIYGISCGMNVERQRNRINQLLIGQGCFWEMRHHLIHGGFGYYDAPLTQCPFPTHPNYDLKAWSWLQEHIELLKDPVTFWNIGS